MAEKDKKDKQGAPAKKGKGGGKKGKAAPERPRRSAGIPRLSEFYRSEIVPGMMKHFNYRNVMEVPRLVKVVVNMGVGEGSRDIKPLDAALEELTLITGQRANIRRSRKSIANFKLREGMPVGCSVTLRGARMFEFLDRLINVAFPRIRDFRGLPLKSFDGRGNHSLGIQEHLVFTELDYSKVAQIRGLNVCTVTTARTDDEARELLRMFGMPFRDA